MGVLGGRGEALDLPAAPLPPGRGPLLGVPGSWCVAAQELVVAEGKLTMRLRGWVLCDWGDGGGR